MGRAFRTASTQYGIVSSTPVSGAGPFTIAGWQRPVIVTGSSRRLFSLVNMASSTDHYALAYRPGSSDFLLSGEGGSSPFTTVGASETAGVWYHISFTNASSTSRNLYFNGTAGSTDTISFSPSNITGMVFGGLRYNGTYSAGINDDLAEWGLWNIALLQGDINKLAKLRLSPRLVRPEALVGHWAFGGESVERDSIGNRNIVLINAPLVCDGPPIIAVSQRPVLHLTSAVAAGFMPRQQKAILQAVNRAASY